MANPGQLPEGFEIITSPPAPQLSPGAQALRKVYGGTPPVRPHQLSDEMLPFSDEFQSAVGATTSYLGSEFGLNPGGGAVSWPDLYSGYKEQRGAEQERYRAEHPYKSIGGAVVGGAAMPIKPGAVKAGTMLATTLRGAGTGAGWGSLFGFGEGSGLGERAESAAMGAGIGVGAGTAIPLLFRGGGLLVNMFRGKGTGPAKAQARAAQLLQESLQEDGLTPAKILTLTAGGKPLTVADLGPKTRKLLGSAYRMAGEGQGTLEDFLNNRSTGQFARLTKDVAESLDVDPADFARVGGEIVEKRATEAGRNYPAAYAQELDMLADATIRGVLDKPFAKGALKAAERLSLDEGIPIRDANGNFTVRAVDLMKRWMDDRIGTQIRSGRGNQARVWMGVRDEMLTAVDRQSPEFAAARAAYAGDSSLIDALKNGRKFLRGDSEDIGAAFSTLSPGEQEMFRLGAAREMREVMGRVVDGGDAARIFKSPNNRDRLREIFADEETFTGFMAKVEDEITMHETRVSVLGNSATAGRLADDAAYQAGPLGEVANAAADVARYGASRGLISEGVKLAADAQTRMLRGLNRKASDALIEQVVDPAQGLRQNILGGGLDPSLSPVIRCVERPLINEATQPAMPAGALPEGFEIMAPAPQTQAPQSDIPVQTTGGHVDMDRVNKPVLDRFTALQRRWGSGLPVSSAYRSPEYNAKVGGAKKSQHMHGDALDIDLAEMPPEKRLRLINMASEAGFTGIGIYDNSIHLDMGGRRAWGPSRSSDSIPKWAKTVIDRHLARQG